MDDDFEYDQVQALMQVKELGLEAEKFLNTRLARFIIDRIDDETETALQELVKTSPHDPQEIQKLQNKVQMGSLMKEWFEQAVQDGINAEQALKP
jgi:hypothetical protein